jgi:glycosyltransferase involved in cell wall biosynthesis
MARMKIGLIVDKCAPFFIGGYEDRHFQLARYLSQRNEVQVFTSLDEEAVSRQGVQFRRVVRSGGRRNAQGSRSYVHGLEFALSLCSDPTGTWDPDVLIVEAIPYLHLATMRGWIGNSRAVRVLNVNEAWVNYRYVSGPFGLPAARTIRHLLSIGIDWADVVMPISNATARAVESNFHPKRMMTVPMGFAPSAESRPADNSKITSSPDFVFVGRLVPPKRPADFLWALHELRKRDKWEGNAVLIGGGPLYDEMVRLRASLGLEDYVAITGVIPEERRNEYLRKSHIFVLPSEREGFSLATLEGMSFGLPAVVARPSSPEVFGVSQIVIDGITGLYFTLGDVSDLASKLRELLLDREKRNRMSIAATTIASQYNWNSIGGYLEAQLRDVVNRK